MKTLKRILTLGLMAIAPILSAKDIYVDKLNQGIEDGTIEHPYNSIQDGLYFMQNEDVVNVASGVYEENLEWKVNTSGTLQGVSPKDTTIKGINRNLNGSATIYIHDTSDVAIRNFLISNGDYGIYGNNLSDLTIKDNLIIGNKTFNIALESTGLSIIDGNTLDGDSVYGNTRMGLSINDTLTSDSLGNKIINNIIVNHSDRGLQVSDVTDKAIVTFNNLYNNLDYYIVNPITNESKEINLELNLSKDPLFRNRLSADYELISDVVTTSGMALQSTRSPCIDVGTSNGYEPDGFTDMGCYNKYGRLEREKPSAVKSWSKYE